MLFNDIIIFIKMITPWYIYQNREISLFDMEKILIPISLT